MSQYPNYASVYAPPGYNPRPGSVTAIAIVGIVWASLLLLCNAFGLIPLFVPNFGNFGGASNPAMDALRADAFANIWTIAMSLLGIVLAFLLLAGSIGALKLSPWARPAMNVFAVFEILASVANTVVTMAVINPIVVKALGGQLGQSKGMVEMFQQGSAVVTALIAVAYPVCVLIVMNRARARAAFAVAGGGGSGVGVGGTAVGETYPPQPDAGSAGTFPAPQGPYGQP